MKENGSSEMLDARANRVDCKVNTIASYKITHQIDAIQTRWPGNALEAHDQILALHKREGERNRKCCIFEQRPHQVEPSNNMRESDPSETFNMSADQYLNVQNVKNMEYKYSKEKDKTNSNSTAKKVEDGKS